MNTAAVQILTGAAGAAAFALYVHMRPKLLPAAAFGSVLGWGVYLLIYHFHPHLFSAICWRRSWSMSGAKFWPDC